MSVLMYNYNIKYNRVVLISFLSYFRQSAAAQMLCFHSDLTNYITLMTTRLHVGYFGYFTSIALTAHFNHTYLLILAQNCWSCLPAVPAATSKSTKQSSTTKSKALSCFTNPTLSYNGEKWQSISHLGTNNCKVSDAYGILMNNRIGRHSACRRAVRTVWSQDVMCCIGCCVTRRVWQTDAVCWHMINLRHTNMKTNALNCWWQTLVSVTAENVSVIAHPSCTSSRVLLNALYSFIWTMHVSVLLGVTIEAEAGMTIYTQRCGWQLKAA